MSTLKLSEIVRNTAKNEGGIRGFYKGGLTAMLGIVIYKGVGFTSYEYLKSANKDRLLNSINILHFSSGAIAGFIGQLVSYPIEVTKRRLQVKGSFESGMPTASNSSMCMTQASSRPSPRSSRKKACLEVHSKASV